MALITSDPSAYTNFIHPSKDLLAWVMGRLDPPTASDWSVAKYTGTNYDSLFDFVKHRLSTGDRPAVVAVYTGSEYSFAPRRTAKFSVLCLMKYPRRREDAQSTVFDLADIVIGRMDNQLYENARVKVAFDRGLDFRGTEIDCVEVGFVILDF